MGADTSAWISDNSLLCAARRFLSPSLLPIRPLSLSLSFSRRLYLRSRFVFLDRFTRASQHGVDFAVRRHQPPATLSAAAAATTVVQLKKGGQRYIQCLFICNKFNGSSTPELQLLPSAL